MSAPLLARDIWIVYDQDDDSQYRYKGFFVSKDPKVIPEGTFGESIEEQAKRILRATALTYPVRVVIA